MKNTSIFPKISPPHRSARSASMQAISCCTARTASFSFTKTSPHSSATRPSAASKIRPVSHRPPAAARCMSRRKLQNKTGKPSSRNLCRCTGPSRSGTGKNGLPLRRSFFMPCFLPPVKFRGQNPAKNRRACRNFRIKKQGIFPCIFLFPFYRPAALRRFTMSRPISWFR